MILQVLLRPNLSREIKEYYFNLERNGPTEDAGIDIPIPETVNFNPKTKSSLVKLGIHTRMLDNDGNEVAYTLHPRSSIYKTPYRLANSTGIIDKTYRGELGAPLDIQSHYHDKVIDFTILLIIIVLILNWLENMSLIVLAIIVYSLARASLYTNNLILIRGTRLVQLCAPNLEPINIEVVNNLPDTIRGENGFGSSGTNI